MTAQEAKDFLVGQAAQQASLDGVSLSDIEKRMMYFTASAEATEDPVALNNAFEAQYNTAEYETKVSRLLSHAFLRVKKENSATARHWSAAVNVLRKGDHYILVLLNQRLSGERPPYDSLKLFGAALLVILIIISSSYWHTITISTQVPGSRKTIRLLPPGLVGRQSRRWCSFIFTSRFNRGF
jgi:hypothetical protein